MSYPRMHPDDAIVPNDPDYRHHPQGRAAPAFIEPSFEIKLDGVVIGTVYTRKLTGGAQLDLEDATTTRQMIAWLVTYANGDAKQVEEIIRRMPMDGIFDLVRGIMEALSQSIKLGNVSGPR